MPALPLPWLPQSSLCQEMLHHPTRHQNLTHSSQKHTWLYQVSQELLLQDRAPICSQGFLVSSDRGSLRYSISHILIQFLRVAMPKGHNIYFIYCYFKKHAANKRWSKHVVFSHLLLSSLLSISDSSLSLPPHQCIIGTQWRPWC